MLHEMRPRIGVTCTQALRDDRLIGEVSRAFTDAVTRVGGIPMVLPVLDGGDADEVISALDGLLLSGGGDVVSSYYGGDPGEAEYSVDGARDAWELALVAAARAAGLPILGVCRGAQLLNVACGGTLVQHLPRITYISHRLLDRDLEMVHDVRIDPASTLSSVTGQQMFGVNSLHHQAVARPGSGLRAVAWAPDGVIEAVESTDGWAVLGVQWHPELLIDQAAHLAVFSWLVQAAVRRKTPAAPVPLNAPASTTSTVRLIDELA
jgi:putative glutamine amidotransferase